MLIESHEIHTVVFPTPLGEGDEAEIVGLWVDKDGTLWTVQPSNFEIEYYGLKPVKGVIV